MGGKLWIFGKNYKNNLITIEGKNQGTLPLKWRRGLKTATI